MAEARFEENPSVIILGGTQYPPELPSNPKEDILPPEFPTHQMGGDVKSLESSSLQFVDIVAPNPVLSVGQEVDADSMVDEEHLDNMSVDPDESSSIDESVHDLIENKIDPSKLRDSRFRIASEEEENRLEQLRKSPTCLGAKI
jgi:hypothetical protein